jgi:tetratricopeptide (TPR) repeat protein
MKRFMLILILLVCTGIISALFAARIHAGFTRIWYTVNERAWDRDFAVLESSFRAGENGSAGVLIEQLLIPRPDDRRLLAIGAEYYLLRVEKPERGIPLLVRYAAGRAGDIPLLRRTVPAMVVSGYYGDALEILARYDLTSEKELLMARGRAELGLRRNVAALKSFQEAVRAGYDTGEVHHRIGALLEAGGNDRDAEPAYRRALEREPARMDSRMALIGILTRRKDLRGAAALKGE